MDKLEKIKNLMERMDHKHTQDELILMEDRTSMSELMGQEADNVDTLLQFMSKYTPEGGWFTIIGYLNNVSRLKAVANIDQELTDYGSSLNDEYINSIINSDAYKGGGKFRNPHAAYQSKGEKFPSTMFSLKTYECNWLSSEGRGKLKADKDAQRNAIFAKHNMQADEIEVDDPRGLGWESLPNTPFEKHVNTGTMRYAMYRKVNDNRANNNTVYFLSVNNEIVEISKEKAQFFFKMGASQASSYPKRYDEYGDDVKQELIAIDNLYEFKNLDLSKIAFIKCSCKIDGKPIKLSYLNKNAAPNGVEEGRFADIIEKVAKL